MKAAREQPVVTCKGFSKASPANFSSETWETRIQWAAIIIVLKFSKVINENPVSGKTVL